jgi:hypothetical protein
MERPHGAHAMPVLSEVRLYGRPAFSLELLQLKNGQPGRRNRAFSQI